MPTGRRPTNQGTTQMARFIIIDTNSGYIFGDTAELTNAQFDCELFGVLVFNS